MKENQGNKKRDMAIFWWDRQKYCLIIKQKAGWLVGMHYKLKFNEKRKKY
jgi:hypothetical protein